MHPFIAKLRGGDLRSIGAANEVAREAIEDSKLVAPLVAGLRADEPVVRMRCADALEKTTRVRPEYLQPFGKQLLALIDPSQPKEVLWHILQMAPRIHWSRPRRNSVFAAVQSCLDHPSSIVKTCAMQSIAELATAMPDFRSKAEKLLKEMTATGTAAMRSRGKKLLSQMDVATTYDH